MAQDSWPSPAHNSRAVTDAEYERVAQRFSDDGVYGTPADPAVITAGTGLSVDVRANVAASVRGHAWSSGTTTVNLPVAANASGSTRVDWVVLRLDRSAWTVRAVIRQGTPGAGAPALVQDQGDTGFYEIPLAQVTVLSGAVSVTVTRAELYVGARIRPCTSTTRNPNPVRGEGCFETDTGRVRIWDGSAWVGAVDQSGEVIVNSPVTAWKWTVDSVLQRRNGVVTLRLGWFQRTGGAPTGAVRLPVLIPSAYLHPNRDQYVLCYVTGTGLARATISSRASDTPGQVWLTQYPAIAKDDFVLPSSGVSWVVD
ncbi:hypothetical protein [Streptomyces griseosporeus]|uniref:hypothetical protein n=1 Tax=Streptomyces griseosporeus TaxID=1910 RepID=UPI0036FF76AE